MRRQTAGQPLSVEANAQANRRSGARPGVPRMWTRGPHAQNAGPRPGLGPGRQAMLPPARLAGLPTWPGRRSASPPAAPNGQIARRPGPGARPE